MGYGAKPAPASYATCPSLPRQRASHRSLPALSSFDYNALGRFLKKGSPEGPSPGACPEPVEGAGG